MRSEFERDFDGMTDALHRRNLVKHADGLNKEDRTNRQKTTN